MLGIDLRGACLGLALMIAFTHSSGAQPMPAQLSASLRRAGDERPAAVQLPQLDTYRRETIQAKVPRTQDGQVELVSSTGIACLSESFASSRLQQFQQMQGTEDTKIIAISGGAMRLDQVVDAINDPDAITSVEGETLVRLPLLVTPEATLIIDGEQTPTVRFVTARGAFLASIGTLIVLDTTVTSWDEIARKPTTFTDANQFRPFVTAFAGSEIYCANSRFAHLGYGAPSSYGFSMTSHPRRHTPESDGNWPTGMLVENVFEGLYYGYYSFEARDVAIVRNQYLKCIRYGIDPHDRSTRLLIADNLAEGTIERHGIIGSREVNHSLIINNISRNNTKSGIMLDRQCSQNLIYGNQVYDNGNGIAIYESSDNRIEHNHVVFNDGNGVRIRNSTDLLVFDNTIVGNAGFAISCESKQLDDHAKRVARGDTYEQQTSADVFHNIIAHNIQGSFKGTAIHRLRVTDVRTTVDEAAVGKLPADSRENFPRPMTIPWGRLGAFRGRVPRRRGHVQPETGYPPPPRITPSVTSSDWVPREKDHPSALFAN